MTHNRPKPDAPALTDVQKKILEIERRANVINLKLATLCRLTGVKWQNLWRWKKGVAAPGHISFVEAINKLEAFLDDEERRICSAAAPPAENGRRGNGCAAGDV